MELTRRRFGSIVVGTAASLSGCSLLQGPLTFEAEPAGVPDQVEQNTGYRRVRRKTPTLRKKIAGKKVEVTNTLTEFQKRLDLDPIGKTKLGVFVAFTTPAVKIAGQGPFNPVAGWSTKQLVMQLQRRYPSLKNVTKAGSTSVSVLGKSRTVNAFTATTTLEGVEFDLRLHVGKFQHRDDFVVPLGAYPKRLTGERENVLTLMRRLEHPV